MWRLRSLLSDPLERVLRVRGVTDPLRETRCGGEVGGEVPLLLGEPLLPRAGGDAVRGCKGVVVRSLVLKAAEECLLDLAEEVGICATRNGLLLSACANRSDVGNGQCIEGPGMAYRSEHSPYVSVAIPRRLHAGPGSTVVKPAGGERPSGPYFRAAVCGPLRGQTSPRMVVSWWKASDLPASQYQSRHRHLLPAERSSGLLTH
jgi:hypothetical protein